MGGLLNALSLVVGVLILSLFSVAQLCMCKNSSSNPVLVCCGVRREVSSAYLQITLRMDNGLRFRSEIKSNMGRHVPDSWTTL